MIDGTDFEQGSLLAQPLKRVGYSDRTAWLIAVMSELDYLRFEGADGLSGPLDDLARAVGQERAAVAAALAPLLGERKMMVLAFRGTEKKLWNGRPTSE